MNHLCVCVLHLYRFLEINEYLTKKKMIQVKSHCLLYLHCIFSFFQSCVCPNRFLIQEDVFDEFVKTLKNKINSEIVVGNPADPRTTVGPLINKAQVEKVTDSLVTDNADKNVNNCKILILRQ